MENQTQVLDVAEARVLFVERADGSHLKLDEFQAIWNLGLNRCGCVASKGYHIIQHPELRDAVTQATGNLNLKSNISIGTQGHRMYLDVTFPDVKLNVKVGEEFYGGLRIINSYDKTTGLIIVPRLMRLACSNGMVVSSFIGGYSIHHNRPLVEEFASLIEKTLKEMVEKCPKLQAVVEGCITDSIEWSLAQRLIKALIGRDKHIEQIMRNLGNKPSVSRWEIYNAVTAYATHGEQIRPNVEQWLQTKAQKLLSTKLESFPLAEIEVKVR